MKALVTGGAGFIGSHVADVLLARGHEVTAYDVLDPQVHPARRRPGYLDPRVRLVTADTNDRAALTRALRGADAVFHLAAAVGVGQSQYRIDHYIRANVGGTGVLLDILANRPHQVRSIVVASSMSSYGEGLYTCPRCRRRRRPPTRQRPPRRGESWDPPCPKCDEPLRPVATPETEPFHSTSVYAVTKATQEDLVLTFGRAYGIPCVALRYFNAYGPRQSLSNPYTGVGAIFLSRIKNGKPPLIYEDGLQSRDFIHVRDVAEATVRAAECPEAAGHAINIGTGRPIAILEVARTLARILGSRVRPKVLRRQRRGDVRHCFPDVRRLRKLLGYRAHVSLEEGMRDLAAWSAGQTAVDRIEEAQEELRRRGLA